MRSVLKNDPFKAMVERITSAKLVRAPVEQRHDHFFELVIQRSGFGAVIFRQIFFLADGPAGGPSTQPSIHQPSRILKLGTPFSAAFMPLVPEASKGRCGVFSHRSTPLVMSCAQRMS